MNDDETLIDVLGVWWLPENPDRKIHGVLTWTARAGATLRLHDVLRPDDDYEWQEGPDGTRKGRITSQSSMRAGHYARIVGEANNQGYTLDDALRINATGVLGFGTPSETISGSALVEGAQFEHGEALEFSRCSVELGYLTEWSGLNALEIEDSGGQDPTLRLNVRRVPKLVVPVDEANVALTLRTSSRRDTRQVVFMQAARVLVEFGDGELRPVSDFMNLVDDIQDLLTIASGHRSTKGGVEFRHPHIPLPLKYYARWSFRGGDRPEKVSDLMFRLSDLGVDGLSRYMATARQHRDALRRFMASRYATDQFVEDKTTNTVAALEALARYPRARLQEELVVALRQLAIAAGEPFLTVVGSDVDAWAEEAKNRRHELAHHKAGALRGLTTRDVQLAQELYWLGALTILRRAAAPEKVFEKIVNDQRVHWLATVRQSFAEEEV